MKEKVNVKNFKRLLNRVYLGGVIEECVFNVASDGNSYIQSVDLTNSLFLRCEEELSLGKNNVLGLGNLKILCGFLDSCEEEEISISIKSNRIMFTRKGHGSFSYLLSETDTIPTIVEEEDAVSKLAEGITMEVPIKKAFKEDLLSYLSLTDLGSVRFSIGKDKNKILVFGGMEFEHKFRLFLTNLKKFKEDPYELEVRTKLLVPILNSLEWEEGEEPVFCFGNGFPLIIKNGDNNLWALVPLGEEDEEG